MTSELPVNVAQESAGALLRAYASRREAVGTGALGVGKGVGGSERHLGLGWRLRMRFFSSHSFSWQSSP